MVCYLPINDQFLPGDDLLFSMDVYGPVNDINPYEDSYTVTGIKVEALDMQ